MVSSLPCFRGLGLTYCGLCLIWSVYQSVVCWNGSERGFVVSSRVSRYHLSILVLQLTIASVVAVHGLNPRNRDDHAQHTWEDQQSKHLWLRDAFPLDRPNIRTVLYSYESSPAFGTDKERFVHQANSLLECLRLLRRQVRKQAVPQI